MSLYSLCPHLLKRMLIQKLLNVFHTDYALVPGQPIFRVRYLTKHVLYVCAIEEALNAEMDLRRLNRLALLVDTTRGDSADAGRVLYRHLLDEVPLKDILL